MEVLTPSQEEIDAARDLDAKLRSSARSQVCVVVNVGGVEYVILERAAGFLKALIREVAKGNPVGLVDMDAELSTTEAAELLGVSRPTLVSLLKQDIIPHRMVGTHRRVPHSALLVYRAKHRARSVRPTKERLRATDDLLRHWHAAEEPAET